MCFWYCSQEKYSMILSAGTGKLFKRLNREPDVFTIDLFGNTFNYLLCLKVVSQNSRRGEEQRGKWDNTWVIFTFFLQHNPFARFTCRESFDSLL